MSALQSRSPRVYSVFRRVPRAADTARLEFPAGEYVIVLSWASPDPAKPGSSVVHVTGGKVVTIGGWCTQTLADRVAGVAAADFLLAPPK